MATASANCVSVPAHVVSPVTNDVFFLKSIHTSTETEEVVNTGNIDLLKDQDKTEVFYGAFTYHVDYPKSI